MMWQTKLALLLLAAGAFCGEFTAVKPEELASAVLDKDLTLVLFANKQIHEEQLDKMQLRDALNLLGPSQENLRVLEVDLTGQEGYQKDYGVKQELGPELRFFWKGIMRPAPTNRNFKGLKIYRWLKMNMRAASLPTLETPEIEAFFNLRKEEHPYIVVGIGSRESVEGRFLRDFSQLPSSPYKFYILEEKLARKVFQSIGLSGAKFNTLFINNIGKKITEYMDDYEPLEFYRFLQDQAAVKGSFPLNNQVGYVTSSMNMGHRTLVIFPGKSLKRHRKKRFRQEMKNIAGMFDMNVLYGPIDRSKFIEKVEYSDCDPKGDEACGYVYENYHLPKQKLRYRVTVDNFEPEDVEKALSAIYRNKQRKPFFFSDDSPLRYVSSDSEIRSLSRENRAELLSGGKDSLIVSYMVCGSNCIEKVKLVSEFLDQLSPEVRRKLNVFTCDLKKNEMPENYYAHQTLNLVYVRSTSPDEINVLQGVRSSFDLLEKVKPLATFEIASEKEEDEDFEDYI